MKTVTLRIDDGIIEKFLWLIKNFKNEIKILDQSEYVSDDEYFEINGRQHSGGQKRA